MQSVQKQLTETANFAVVKTNKFSFLKTYTEAIEAPDEDIRYKQLKLVKAASRWYVEYYHKIPAGIRHLHGNATWKRFRIMEDVNRQANPLKKEQYGNRLLKSVAYNLENGYNPFTALDKLFSEKEQNSETITDAIAYYRERLHEKGVSGSTNNRYRNTVDRFQLYLNEKNLSDLKPNQIDQAIVRAFLMNGRETGNWKNATFNSNIRYLSQLFIYLDDARKDYGIKENPCKKIKALKTVSTRHRYYDEKVFPIINAAMQKDFPYLRLVSQFVYYAGVRSANEIATLRVQDILLDRDLIRFSTESKAKREDYIFLDPKLKEIILQNGIMDYPGTHFVFSRQMRPDAKRLKTHFLQSMFRELRDQLKISKDYTLYSFKHTRAIHLLTDGAQPVDIMQQFRHTDLGTTTDYIRDLGFSVATKFADKSRDI